MNEIFVVSLITGAILILVQAYRKPDLFNHKNIEKIIGAVFFSIPSGIIILMISSVILLAANFTTFFIEEPCRIPDIGLYSLLTFVFGFLILLSHSPSGKRYLQEYLEEIEGDDIGKTKTEKEELLKSSRTKNPSDCSDGFFWFSLFHEFNDILEDFWVSYSHIR